MTTNNLKFPSAKSMLRTLVKNSYKAIDEEMYEINGDREYTNHTCLSLRNNILKCKHNPLLTEIKFASPSHGTLVDNSEMKVEEIATIMEKAGAIGISILAQPYLFNGGINGYQGIQFNLVAHFLSLHWEENGSFCLGEGRTNMHLHFIHQQSHCGHV